MKGENITRQNDKGFLQHIQHFIFFFFFSEMQPLVEKHTQV